MTARYCATCGIVGGHRPPRQKIKVMSIRIVQLGKPKQRGEGVRLGTVRRPPRGVPKNRYAAEGYFDVWLPNLAPSAQLINRFRGRPDSMAWKRFAAGYRAEM